MPQQQKSPDVKTCRRLYETIDAIINNGEDVYICESAEGTKVGVISESDLVATRDALEWVYVFLLNRRDYHKRRNAKSKAELTLLTQKLREAGVNVDEIARKAVVTADDAIIDNDDEV